MLTRKNVTTESQDHLGCRGPSNPAQLLDSRSAMDLPGAVLRQAYKNDIIFMLRSLASVLFFFLQNLRLGFEQNRGSVKSEKNQ